MAFKAATKNITLKRGDTYDFKAQLNRVDPDTEQRVPYDLTGFTVKGQVRRAADTSSVWIDLNDHRLRIIDGAKGQFGFKLLGADSEKYHPAGSAEPNNGVYDIQFSKNVGDFDNEQIITYVEGTFTIVDDVTRKQLPPKQGESEAEVSLMTVAKTKKSNFIKTKE